MKASDIRGLGGEELHSKLKDLTETLFNLRFQHKTGQLENPRRIGQVKREIARLHTIQRERELKQ
jgi:large subunit ribosomal protein L29